MARYVMILRGATSLRGALGENRDLFGPWKSRLFWALNCITVTIIVDILCRYYMMWNMVVFIYCNNVVLKESPRNNTVITVLVVVCCVLWFNVVKNSRSKIKLLLSLTSMAGVGNNSLYLSWPSGRASTFYQGGRVFNPRQRHYNQTWRSTGT
jgi:hypothetical protein